MSRPPSPAGHQNAACEPSCVVVRRTEAVLYDFVRLLRSQFLGRLEISRLMTAVGQRVWMKLHEISLGWAHAQAAGGRGELVGCTRDRHLQAVRATRKE